MGSQLDRAVDVMEDMLEQALFNPSPPPVPDQTWRRYDFRCQSRNAHLVTVFLRDRSAAWVHERSSRCPECGGSLVCADLDGYVKENV